MINKHYHDSAIETYGDSCEICGHRMCLEVHHLDYQEHQEIEDRIRIADTDKKKKGLPELLKEAKEKNYLEYHSNQLSKNDSVKNLSVLCGNCHKFIHKIDCGQLLLKALKDRKEDI